MDYLSLVVYLYVRKSCFVTDWVFEFVTDFLSCKGYGYKPAVLNNFQNLNFFLLHEQTVLLRSVLKFNINSFSKREK